LLLVSCFYTLRPFQIVLLISSCGADRREIRRFVERRVQGIAPYVPSFYTVSQLRGIKETHNCTHLGKMGSCEP